MHYWAPANIYRNNRCSGFATVTPPAFWNDDGTNLWDQGGVNSRYMNNEAESAMVPPGWKLEMWDVNNENAAPYTIIGSMRDDLKGI